ncbi:hypothetical protein B0T20DRAFT_274146 [Sordaria brevicollis]|uniref:Uncharacterized protein n=1 Tax=Sordaria brevicollis TaxID=83679 RepID=A0AAE0PAR4_SORBR|nr:hypothetical protein B0T20DRAFT_274146 [Sordaria brevicollis]
MKHQLQIQVPIQLQVQLLQHSNPNPSPTPPTPKTPISLFFPASPPHCISPPPCQNPLSSDAERMNPLPCPCSEEENFRVDPARNRVPNSLTAPTSLSGFCQAAPVSFQSGSRLASSFLRGGTFSRILAYPLIVPSAPLLVPLLLGKRRSVRVQIIRPAS